MDSMPGTVSARRGHPCNFPTWISPQKLRDRMETHQELPPGTLPSKSIGHVGMPPTFTSKVGSVHTLPRTVSFQTRAPARESFRTLPPSQNSFHTRFPADYEQSLSHHTLGRHHTGGNPTTFSRHPFTPHGRLVDEIHPGPPSQDLALYVDSMSASALQSMDVQRRCKWTCLPEVGGKQNIVQAIACCSQLLPSRRKIKGGFGGPDPRLCLEVGSFQTHI